MFQRNLEFGGETLISLRSRAFPLTLFPPLNVQVGTDCRTNSFSRILSDESEKGVLFAGQKSFLGAVSCRLSVVS